jgi:8-oxo-dGTP pyrophosphatase MutT (NUDIX family)
MSFGCDTETGIVRTLGPMSADLPVATRDAATIVIVRPPTARLVGCEVLLLKRTPRASFVAGAHVFPGGVVDDEDARLGSGLGVDRFVVAAIRECFEESGLLFAQRRHGIVISPGDRIRWRSELAAGVATFGGLLTREDLVLDAGPLRYWSRWVTPVGLPKRFDARFFLAPEPAGQHATPDETEITESGWFGPDDALRRADRGEMLLILPTRMTLQTLADSPTLGELLR